MIVLPLDKTTTEGRLFHVQKSIKHCKKDKKIQNSTWKCATICKKRIIIVANKIRRDPWKVTEASFKVVKVEKLIFNFEVKFFW